MRAYEDEVALIEAVAPRLVAACPPEVEVRRGEGGTNALDAHYVMSIVPARTDASKRVCSPTRPAASRSHDGRS